MPPIEPSPELCASFNTRLLEEQELQRLKNEVIPAHQKLTDLAIFLAKQLDDNDRDSCTYPQDYTTVFIPHPDLTVSEGVGRVGYQISYHARTTEEEASTVLSVAIQREADDESETPDFTRRILEAEEVCVFGKGGCSHIGDFSRMTRGPGIVMLKNGAIRTREALRVESSEYTNIVDTLKIAQDFAIAKGIEVPDDIRITANQPAASV